MNAPLLRQPRMLVAPSHGGAGLRGVPVARLLYQRLCTPVQPVIRVQIIRASASSPENGNNGAASSSDPAHPSLSEASPDINPTPSGSSAWDMMDRFVPDDPVPGLSPFRAGRSGTVASAATERTLSDFTWERWAAHRSSTRYTRHMLGIVQSDILRRLAQPLFMVFAVSSIVCMYEDLLKDGAFPDYFPSFYMPLAPFDLTSFALSLLLVFRTNTSYERWNEVISVWSGLANRARDTMRQALSHLSDGNGAISPVAGAMCRWVIAFTRSLKAELVESCDLEGELREVLTPEELRNLLAARHPPSFALSVLTELSATQELKESHRIRLDENLTYFEDAVGTCERILRTPIPLGWTRHTSRFMVIWLSSLPLGLYSSCSWATIPLCLVIAFLLLGIDDIGVVLEAPFPFIPLDEFCEEVESDLFSILREATVTKRTAAMAAAAALGQLAVVADGEGGEAAPFSPLPPAARRTVPNKGRYSWEQAWEGVPDGSKADATAAAAAAAAASRE